MHNIKMKPADKKNNKYNKKKKDKKKEKEELPTQPPTPVQEIKYNVVLIEQVVATFESRFSHCAWYKLTASQKWLDNVVLKNTIEEVLASASICHLSPVMSPSPLINTSRKISIGAILGYNHKNTWVSASEMRDSTGQTSSEPRQGVPRPRCA
jgi:chorismate-pyruvate lyase